MCSTCRSGLYLSFETDDRPDRLADAFPPATLARLRQRNALYDADNVFNQNFAITPDADKAGLDAVSVAL